MSKNSKNQHRLKAQNVPTWDDRTAAKKQAKRAWRARNITGTPVAEQVE